MKNKAIILSGGKATRLYPITQFGISKQLIPVYNKPMIDFPIRTLQEMGITDVLVIVADAEQLKLFKNYLKDGSWFGMRIEYKIQEKPRGLAEAFILAEDFLSDVDHSVLILGDNCFLGTEDIYDITPNTVFTYKVKDPSAYGVVEISKYGNRISKIVEKPKEFISNDALVGLYCLSNRAIEIAKTLKPSARGELEIVDVIKAMDELEGVKVRQLDSGFWFDCGTHEDLLECANLVRAIEKRTNMTLGIKKS